MKESVGPSLGAQRAMLGGEPDISWKEGKEKSVSLFLDSARLAPIWDPCLKKM